MINEQQKEAIKQSEILIDKMLKASLLNLIHDICENINDKDYNDDSKTFEYVNDLKNSILNYTLEIKEILKLSLPKRDTYLKKIFETKNLILEIYNSTFLCITYFKQKIKCITMDIFIKENDDLKLEYNDVATLLRDCMAYVNMQKESVFNSMSMSKIMSLIPLKMTKMKYYDYVKESLNFMFSTSNTDLVRRLTETLKYKFAPFKFENLNKYHADTVKEIDNLIEVYSNSSKDERDNEVKESIQNLLIKLDYSMSLCSMMYNDINYILNIASLCIDEEFLFNNDLIFKDLYFSTCDIIKSKDNLVFLDNVLKDSEARIEEITDELENLEKKFAKNFKSLEGIQLNELPQELSTCLYSHKIAYDNFYDDISIIPVDNYKPGDEEVASKEFVEEKIEEILSFIEDAVKDIDKHTIKLLKQLFLQYIVCPFKYNEFEKYLFVCFEDIKGTNYEKAAIINIFNLIHFKHLPNMTSLVEYDRYVVHSIDESYESYDDYLDTYMKKHFHEISSEDSCECGHEHHHHH